MENVIMVLYGGYVRYLMEQNKIKEEEIKCCNHANNKNNTIE
jgi:hypothetical protein